MIEKHDLIRNWPGGILRLGLHMGAAKAWSDLGLSLPDEEIGSSAGAIAASAMAGQIDEAAKIVGSLSPNQIFSYRRGLKIKLATLGVTTGGLIILILLDHKLSRGKKAVLGLTGLATLLTADAIVGNELIHSESHLSSEPLRNLLRTKLDFNAIFNSPRRIGVIVADVVRPGELIFYNHDPLNNNPNNPVHTERWVNILLASARLPGKFQFVKIDGVHTADGEIWTDFPIRQMKKFKKIFRFDYWPPLQPAPAPREWISDTMRSFDIMRDRCTQKKIEYYELERKGDHSLPEIYYVRLSRKLIHLAPRVQLHDFTPDQMKDLENIGYAAIIEQEQQIRRYLNA